MKKKDIGLRRYFLISIFGILLGAYLVATFALEGLDKIWHFSRYLPIVVCNIIMTVIVGLLLSWILSKNIMKSLTRLSTEMERVASGDFRSEIKIKATFEKSEK